MREIVRTNDAVLISAIEALLKGAAYRPYGRRSEYERAGRLDRHFSAAHPGRRRRDPASRGGFSRRPASATSFAPMPADGRLRVSEDAVLGGKLLLASAAARPSFRPRRDPAGRGDRRARPASARSNLVPGSARPDWRWRAASTGVDVTLVELDPALAALASRQRGAQRAFGARARGLSRRCGAGRGLRRRRARAGLGGPCPDESAVQCAAKSVARSRSPSGA